MADRIPQKHYHKVLRQYMSIAIKHPNPTIAIPDCRVYRFIHNGKWKELDIMCFRREDLADPFLQWAYYLAERNLKQKYLKYGLAWENQHFYKNMFVFEARYLVAFETSDYNPFGYVMFRFDLMMNYPVVYIDGIHVEIKNKGIGTHLMVSLEVLARRFGVQLLIISVAQKNIAVKQFLSRLGFTADAMKDAKHLEYEVLIAPTHCYKIIREGLSESYPKHCNRTITIGL